MRSPIVKDLRSPKYKPQTIADKKKQHAKAFCRREFPKGYNRLYGYGELHEGYNDHNQS